MNYRLRVRRQARLDLISLHDRITTEAGAAIATGYVRRVDATIAALESFPNRGTPRPSVPGMRSITFERRHIILYLVKGDLIEILRVLDARRDWPRLLSG